MRRYVERFLHGKAYLFGDATDARVALVTSANLTGAGLYSNLELGLTNYDAGCRRPGGVVVRRSVGSRPSTTRTTCARSCSPTPG